MQELEIGLQGLVLELSSEKWAESTRHGDRCGEDLEEAVDVYTVVDHGDKNARDHCNCCNFLNLIHGVFILLARPSIVTFSMSVLSVVDPKGQAP